MWQPCACFPGFPQPPGHVAALSPTGYIEREVKRERETRQDETKQDQTRQSMCNGGYTANYRIYIYIYMCVCAINCAYIYINKNKCIALSLSLSVYVAHKQRRYCNGQNKII